MMLPTAQLQRAASARISVAPPVRHGGRVQGTRQHALILRHHDNRSAQLARLAAPRTATRRGTCVVVAAKAGGEVLVAGATGQTAARIVLQLAKAGYKVTAGVADLEAAQEALAFAKKVELLLPNEAAAVKAVELDLGDAESLAAALPKRGGRVVLVAGDIAEGRRADPKQVQRAVDSLVASGSGLAQLVLVTPVGGASGTGIFGFGKPRPDVLSKLEEQVVESGLGFLIVRTATTDRVPDSYGVEANPVVAGFGTLPAGLSVSRSQVAAAVVEAMGQAQGNAILEVGADSAALPVPVADQVSKVLADIAAARQQRAEEEEAVEEAAEEAAAGLGSLFKTVKGGTTRQQRGGKALEVVEAVAVVEEEAAEEKPAKRGLFGTLRISRPAKAAQPEPAVEEEEKEKEKPARKGVFGFGTQRLRAGKQQEQAAVEDEEQEKPAPKRGGLFGGQRAAAQREPEAEEAPAPAAKPKIVRGRKPLPAPEEKKPARAGTVKQQQQAAAAVAEEKPKKKGGFLQALGINQETVYVDEA